MAALPLPNFEPTVWEQKVRDYRLKNETPDVRAWREEAEDPNTTGDRLAFILHEIKQETRRRQKWIMAPSAQEAIIRNPNATLPILVPLMERFGDAFCQNPAAPFVVLEDPGFVQHLSPTGVCVLMREATIPISLLHAIAAQKGLDWRTDPDPLLGTTAEAPPGTALYEKRCQMGVFENARSARQHIKMSGEIQSQMEGEAQIEAAWKYHGYVPGIKRPSVWVRRPFPRWLAHLLKKTQPEPREIAAGLPLEFEETFEFRMNHWRQDSAFGRLTLVFALPAHPFPLPIRGSIEAYDDNYENEGGRAGCTTRDLLEHFTRDGDRLVRWAAQTRLADTEYIYKWR